MKEIFAAAHKILCHFRHKLTLLAKEIINNRSFYLTNEELADMAHLHCPSTPPRRGGDLFLLYVECFSSYSAHRAFTSAVSSPDIDDLKWNALFRDQQDSFGAFLFQSLKAIGTSVNSHFHMRHVAAQAFGMTRAGLDFFAKLGVICPPRASADLPMNTWQLDSPT